MSQKIINACDLCKTTIPHEDTIWTVGVLTSQRIQGRRQHSSSHNGLPKSPSMVDSNPAKSLECCRKCMEERFQLVPQQTENKNTLSPAPSLEDLIVDIAIEAAQDYHN